MTSSVSPNIDLKQLESRILTFLNTGQFASAESASLMLIAHDSTFDRSWFYLGAAYHGQEKYDDALSAFLKATNAQPNHIDAWHALATILSIKQLYSEALIAAESALALNPASPASLTNVGTAWQQLGSLDKSIDYFQRALEFNRAEKSASINLVANLVRLNRMQTAKAACLEALQFHPDETALYNNLAEACIYLSEFDEALAACDSGLKTDQRNAHLHLKRGLVLAYLKRFDEAQQALTWAQVLKPTAIKEYFPQWFEINNHLNQDIEIALDARIVYINAIFKWQQRCEWRMRDDYAQMIKIHILEPFLDEQAEAVTSLGFQMYSFPVAAQTRLEIMRKISLMTQSKAWCAGGLPFKHIGFEKSRLRIGYMSPDFRQHATAVLTRQLYQMHDREAFEIYAYSLFNAKESDDYRRNIEASCDVFLDVSNLSNIELAQRIFNDQIDILVDLAGYTLHSRTEVIAMRPAPVQMSYIGFVCTMGADFIDYALVDAIVCADEQLQDWHESPIRLPDCLYIYDNEISNVPTDKRRQDYGLPTDAVVFCCLNDNYKIEPSIFEVWMSILKAVPDSVLWLLGTSEDAEQNLRREAAGRGVDSNRVIFAKRVPMAEHLARYQLADIFLDTYWCNAHTTALEALWQGLPVLTCHGPVASSRIAASFLNALEMPELIAKTFDQYQELAIYYANHHAAREAMREKLKAKRYTAPLFNTELTVRYIERAYSMAWEKYQAGLPAATIDVPAIEANHKMRPIIE